MNNHPIIASRDDPSSDSNANNEKLQLFTQPIIVDVVEENGRLSFSSSSSSSLTEDDESNNSSEDDDTEDIKMVWNNAVTDSNNNDIEFHNNNENKVVLLKNPDHHHDEEEETDSSISDNNIISNIQDFEEDKPIIASTEKFSLKEQLKLKFPSSILHLSDNVASNNSSTIDNSSKSDSTPQTLQSETKPTRSTTNQAQQHSIESGEMDDTSSRRFTFNSTDIIKAVFEGKHDEEVEKLIKTDVSDYLTQLVKRKNQITNPVVVAPQSPIKRMNSTFLTPSTPIYKDDLSSSLISSPSSSPNLEKLNTIIEKKKLSRSNTTVHNYTLSPELKQRRKITAIGSGMIPNDFNQVHSPLSDCGVDFSQSDSKLTSSKRSMSIGASIQSYYNTSSSLTNSMKNDSTDDIYRVTFLGSVGVGKSSLINKFIKGSFANEYNSTVFEDIYHKPLMFLKYQEIKLLEILDTSALHIKHYKNKTKQEDESPSMEIPSSFLSDYIINCDAYILVYSVDDIQSYKYCKDIYKSIVGQKKLAGLKRTKSNLRASGNGLIATPRTVARSDIPLVLVGNKSDVGVEEKFIDPKMVWEDVHTELAFGSNCSFVETSAKKEDVDCVFQALVNRICLREEPKTSSKIQISSSLPSTTNKHDPNKKCVIL